MKTIGILGGLGPEATADYYKLIIEKFKSIDPAGNLNYPEIVIYSVNMSKFISMLECKNYKEAVNYLSLCLSRIQAAGADFAAISANTPHLLFDDIEKNKILPLISIVEAVREKAVELGLKKLCLLGTKFTMKNSFYTDVFKKSNIEIVVPATMEIDIINEKLFSELEVGIFKASTREIILDIVKRIKNDHHVDGVILGCTEFPLLFMEPVYHGLPFLNSSAIHVEKIVEQCLS